MKQATMLRNRTHDTLCAYLCVLRGLMMIPDDSKCRTSSIPPLRLAKHLRHATAWCSNRVWFSEIASPFEAVWTTCFIGDKLHWELRSLHERPALLVYDEREFDTKLQQLASRLTLVRVPHSLAEQPRHELAKLSNDHDGTVVRSHVSAQRRHPKALIPKPNPGSSGAD